MPTSPLGLSSNLPHMKLILALLAGLGLALYILIMAEGPDLLDIINRF